ncbi:hypothetical protein SETIT_1G327200v2 [Setaria italica]|uniref:BHLH domain-containing protein n=1 Tax=Setaria italica TaxID=4555 RepID=A0A368PRM7_SETIT|nr:hypothetical protein SETIT_1G327200v2 [Setaria italica]
MALEAVVFPKEHLACTAKAGVAAHLASLGCGFDIDDLEEKGGVVLQEEAAAAALPLGASAATAWDAALCPCSVAPGAVEECWDAQRRLSASPPPVPVAPGRGKAAASAARRRRRRPKAVKNTEEMESQRRNHIAVERNRRRQMNEYLAVLRSVMPPSYAQRVRTSTISMAPAVLSVHRALRQHRPSCKSFAGHVTMHVHERLGVHRVVDCRCPPNFYCKGRQILLPPGLAWPSADCCCLAALGLV